MKYLRLALEEDNPSAQASMIELRDHIEALSEIGGGVSDEGGISMESILRSSGDSAAARVADFKVAMEDLSAGVWAAIAAGIAALIALIYKAIEHFLGSGSKGGGGAIAGAVAKLEVATEESKKTQETAKAVESVLRHEPVEVEGENGTKKLHSLNEVMAATPNLVSEYEQVMERHMEFVYGPARENVFIKALEAKKGFESETYKAVEMATRNFDQVTDYLLRDVDYDKADVASYRRLIDQSKKIEVLQAIHVGGEDTTVGELAHELNEAHKESQTKKSGVHNNVMDVIANLGGYFEHDNVLRILKAMEMNLRESRDAAKKLEEAQSLAKMVDREAKKYQNDSDDDERKEYLATALEGNRLYSKFISEYAGQLRGSITISNLLVSFSNHLSHAQHEVNTFIDRAVSEIMKTGKEVPDQLRQLAKNK